jgi:hypothetical protein
VATTGKRLRFSVQEFDALQYDGVTIERIAKHLPDRSRYPLIEPLKFGHHRVTIGSAGMRIDLYFIDS